MDTAKPSQDSTQQRSNFDAFNQVHSYSFEVPKRLRNFLIDRCMRIGKQTNTDIKIRTDEDKLRKLTRKQRERALCANLQFECQIYGPTLNHIQQAHHEITTALYSEKSKTDFVERQIARANYSFGQKQKKENTTDEPSNSQGKKNKKKPRKENKQANSKKTRQKKEHSEANPKKTKTAKLVVPLPGKIKIEKSRTFPNKSFRVKPLSDLEIRKLCRKNEVTLKVSKDHNKWLLRKELKFTFRTTMDNFVSCHRCLREYSTHSGLLSHLRNKGCVARCIKSPIKLRADKQVFLYSCYSCSLHFTDLRTYKAHVEDRGCTFVCLDCEKSSKNFADFLIHRAVTHRRQELKPRRDDCCSRVFLTFSKMGQHKNNCQSTNSIAPQYVPMPEILDRDFVKLETNVLSVIQTENTIVIGPPGITKIDIEKQKQKNEEQPTRMTCCTNNCQTQKPPTNRKQKRTNNNKNLRSIKSHGLIKK